MTLLLGLLTLPALAAEAPAWRWPAGETRSWLMEACVELPEPLPLRDDDGDSARIDRYQLQLVTSCTAATEAPTGWSVACSLAATNLLAEAIPGDEADLAVVLDAMDLKLEPAWVELGLSRDGQIDLFVLHDVAGKDRRGNRTGELLAWMVERAFLGLELSFAPGGELSWGERGPALLTYLPRARSLGAARMLNDGALSADGHHLEIRSRGRGVVQADTISVRTGLGTPGALSLSMAAQGSAVFDLDEGTLEKRTWIVLSRTTPSSEHDEMNMRHPYAMAGAVQRVQPGQPISLSPTGVWGSSPPGQTCEALDQARAGLEAALDAPMAPRQ